MKKLILCLLLIFSLGILAGCATVAKDQQGKHKGKQDTAKFTAKEMRIGIMAAPQFAPILIVKQKAWIEEQLTPLGVTVKWASYSSGPQMNEDFAKGIIDVGFIGDVPAIIAKSKGLNSRIISMSCRGPQGVALLALEKSTATSIKDYKGKKIGLVFNSYGHNLVLLLLEQAGMTTSDVEMVNLSHPDIDYSLLSGNVDAAVAFEPMITKMTSQKMARVVADGTGLMDGAVVIVAMDNFAKQNPGLIDILLKTYRTGYGFVQNTPNETSPIIDGEIRRTPEQITSMLKKFDYNPVITERDVVELEKSVAFLQKLGLIKDTVNIKGFIDDSYLKLAGI